MTTYNDFVKIDIRVGTIQKVENFLEARKPAYKLWIDFGPEIGIKSSSAQITVCYSKDALVDKQVIAVVNFPKKQIGPFISEVLILGLPNENNDIILVTPEKTVPVGGRLF